MPVVCPLSCIGYVLCRAFDPPYRGRALRSWQSRLLSTQPEERREAVEVLTEALKDRDPFIRGFVVKSLPGDHLPKEMIHVLIEALKHEDMDDIRGEIVGTLAAHRQEAAEAVPALAEAVRTDKDQTVRCWAVRALHMIAPESQETLSTSLTALKDESAVVRREAAERLGERGPAAQQAITALLDATKDRDERVRVEAIKAVKQIDPKAAAQAGIP
jgi:HEAT repeat protein